MATPPDLPITGDTTDTITVGSEKDLSSKELKLKLVQRLMLRGIHDVSEIKASLSRLPNPVNLDDRTIYRYKAIIRGRNAKAIEKKEGLDKSIEELAYDLRLNLEEVLRELWIQYHKPTNIKVNFDHDCDFCHRQNKVTRTVAINIGSQTKVAALKEIRAANEKWVELLQSLGLTFRAPDKHQFLGKDGQPVDPPEVNVNFEKLSTEFTAFVKAKFQDPLPERVAET